MKNNKHIKRFNESEENLNSEPKKNSSSISGIRNSLLNEGKKYEFIDEHPSFKELNSKITDLKKFMKSIGKDLVGGVDYVEEHVEEKLFNNS